MLDEILLERTADAAVLQGNEVLVRFAHKSLVRDQARVHIDLTDVVYNDCNAIALLILKNMVQQRGLARAEIAGEQGNGNLFLSHGCSSPSARSCAGCPAPERILFSADHYNTNLAAAVLGRPWHILAAQGSQGDFREIAERLSDLP